MAIPVTAQYHFADVRDAFSGFDLKVPQPDTHLNMAGWEINVDGTVCDGIMALRLGREGAPTLTLTMGTEEARKLAERLIVWAVHEDAKLDEDDEDDED